MSTVPRVEDDVDIRHLASPRREVGGTDAYVVEPVDRARSAPSWADT